jgi:thimet oligopeptidase
VLLAAGCGGAPPTPTTGPVASAATVGSASASATDSAPAPSARTTLEVIDPVGQGMTVEGVTRLCDDNLALARKLLAEVRASGEDPAKLDFATTLGQLDNAFLAISNASDFPYLMGVTHPEERVRLAARACEGKTDKLMTSIWLDAELFRVIKAYAAKAEALSPERQRFLDHTLRDFRRNGIELSGEKQQRLRDINKEVTELGQRFIAAISSSVGKIRVKPVSLSGLPEAYIKAHSADANGRVTITTDYPDYYPFVTYSRDRAAAKQLYIEFTNRGGDENIGRLDRLLALRTEKAALLGYATWADYAIEPRMASNAKRATAFLERVHSAIRAAVASELKSFRQEYVRISGNQRVKLLPPDRYFLTDQMKSRRFKFDSKELAKHFEVNAVTEGLLAITTEMYGVQYKRVESPLWHPKVRSYEIHDQGKKIGHFYLDLEPRPNKYKHAAMFPIRTAKVLANGTRQTPVAALVCNFPAAGEPMPHDQVVTYFHEFGHVLHHLLTDTELARFAGTNTVRDFVEAPSQMFEEWAWSREVLDRFARHRDSGAKIPDALFTGLSQSRRVGLALSTERQLFLARLDLAYHTRKPGFDSTKLLEQVHNQGFSFEFVPGTHFQTSFGHLIGYDAGYYGYQWALSLAHDVLSRFKKDGLLNPATAADWRRKVLSRGGGTEERSMMRTFLGREPSEAAYVDFLSGKPSRSDK